jgi:hypothetical protein
VERRAAREPREQARRRARRAGTSGRMRSPSGGERRRRSAGDAKRRGNGPSSSPASGTRRPTWRTYSVVRWRIDASRPRSAPTARSSARIRSKARIQWCPSWTAWAEAYADGIDPLLGEPRMPDVTEPSHVQLREYLRELGARDPMWG